MSPQMSLLASEFIREKTMFPTSLQKGPAELLGESKKVDPRSVMSYQSIKKYRSRNVQGNNDLSKNSETTIECMFMSD